MAGKHLLPGLSVFHNLGLPDFVEAELPEDLLGVGRADIDLNSLTRSLRFPTNIRPLRNKEKTVYETSSPLFNWLGEFPVILQPVLLSAWEVAPFESTPSL